MVRNNIEWMEKKRLEGNFVPNGLCILLSFPTVDCGVVVLKDWKLEEIRVLLKVHLDLSEVELIQLWAAFKSYRQFITSFSWSISNCCHKTWVEFENFFLSCWQDDAFYGRAMFSNIHGYTSMKVVEILWKEKWGSAAALTLILGRQKNKKGLPLQHQLLWSKVWIRLRFTHWEVSGAILWLLSLLKGSKQDWDT